MDECINENYNPQCGVSAPGVTQTKDRVLRDKTNVVHHNTPPQKNKARIRMALLLQEAAIQSITETISRYLQVCL
jgi:hypothetical protein